MSKYMTSYPMITKIYTYVWSKYRPAILKLMVDSASGPQQYKFSSHEFKNVNPKEKGGYAFTLRAFQGKAVNSIRTSAVAQDLLVILLQSRKASELIEADTYEFILDKRFVLHVTRVEQVVVIAAEQAPAIEAEQAQEIVSENTVDSIVL
jgi:hypothetical protein